MALTAEDQQRIIAKESAWVDEQFGRLDLSAFPNLQPPPPEQSRDDGQFARDWRDTGLSRDASALRAFVSDPDADALERAGQETGDPNFREEVRERKGETVAAAFKRQCPGYLPTDANYRAIATTLAYNTLSPAEQSGSIDEVVADLIDGNYWTVPNLEACFNALSREGWLDVPAGEPRNLSERERLRVARLAQAGRPDEAIAEFLRCSLDGEEPTMEMINDPAYRTVCDDGVMAVFEEITLDYVATPQRKRFLLRHSGNRPLTIPLLQQAWQACQQNEKRYERGQVLNSFKTPRAPETESLDALSDDAVDDLYHRSLRHYADSIRRTPGIIV